MPTYNADLVEAASTLAVTVASNEPLLFLSADQKVIAASTSFCQAFEVDAASVCGKHLAQLGTGEWAIPQLASLLNATASGIAVIEPYETQLKRPNRETRQLMLNVRVLADENANKVRLLMAVTDVTSIRSEARQKDDLIREKATLPEAKDTTEARASFRGDWPEGLPLLQGCEVSGLRCGRLVLQA
jgi:hypothetical protein